MNTFKSICLTFVQLAKQIPLIPQTIANASERRRLQAVRDEQEDERLDRIRNPSKYRGK